MKKSPSKRRGPWIDVSLVCSIITLGSIIFYFTVLQSKGTADEMSTSATTEEQLVESQTEASTSLAHVTMLEVLGSHSIYPFELQYPKTNDIAINEKISTYISAIKDTYIQEARIAHNAGFMEAGKLQMKTELYSHLDCYYSFVLTTTQQLPNGEQSTQIETFFFHSETGEALTITQLFNSDDESLQTLTSHVQAELLTMDAKKFAYLADRLDANWDNFQYFMLHNGELTLYLLDSSDASPTIVPFTVSLSYLNPLLDTSFQTAMAEAAAPKETTQQGNAADKRIALTFDDGPHPDVTPQILAMLAKYNAKATFYVLGTRVSQSPEIVKQAFEAGHEIGNHTWSHPKLPKLTAAQIQSEFQTTENAIQSILGEPSKTFRPPYGMSNDVVKGIIPLPMVNWSIDTEDWRHRNANMLLTSVQQALHNNAIVLMHDIHQSTADGLERVLAYLQREGYTFVTVSEILPYR